jgi:hypothetical protein
MGKFEWFLAVLVAAVVLGIGYLIVDEYFAADFSLKKRDWHCTKESQFVMNTVVPDGRGGTYLLPQIMTQCDQWTRN